MIKLPRLRKSAAYSITEPIVRLLARTNITPSILTWLGFAITIGAAVLISTGWLLIAGIVVLVAGFFDMLDGALARYTNQVTRYGAFLDSTLDRVSEAVLLLGVLIWYVFQPYAIGILLVAVAFISSQLVSYIRARAEALGLECQIGLFTRPERVIVLAIGLLIGQVAIALGIVILFSFVAMGQRTLHVWKQIKAG
ncbi:CDP-alcohol phosphatidyltransferase family protein [Chloroflexota bacterium]